MKIAVLGLGEAGSAIAAVLIECLEATARLDCEAWTWEQLLTVIQYEVLLDRFLTGSRIHAAPPDGWSKCKQPPSFWLNLRCQLI